MEGKRSRWLVAGGVLLVLALAFVLYQTSTEIQSIDITSGRYRSEQYFAGIKVSDKTEETQVSRLFRKHFGQPPAPKWRTVNKFRGGSGISPHYVHHGSLHAAEMLRRAMALATYSEAAERAAIKAFLGLLQQDDRDTRAKEYAHLLVELSFENKDRQNPIGLEELPPVPKE